MSLLARIFTVAVLIGGGLYRLFDIAALMMRNWLVEKTGDEKIVTSLSVLISTAMIGAAFLGGIYTGARAHSIIWQVLKLLVSSCASTVLLVLGFALLSLESTHSPALGAIFNQTLSSIESVAQNSL